MGLNPFRRSRRRRSSSGSAWLTPSARRAIGGILLLVFSAIAVLSFFEAAGPTGEVVLAALRRAFGWLGYAAPVALIIWGLHLVWPQAVALERLRVIGLSLLAIGLLGILQDR